MLALAALTLALIEGGRAGLRPVVIVAAVVFVVAVAGFVVIERRVPAPMLPLGLFRQRDVLRWQRGRPADQPPLLRRTVRDQLMSFTMPAATTAVVEGAPAERAGLASGAINASRQVGGVVGVALLGVLVSDGAAVISGLRIAVIIAGAAFITGAILTAVTVHRDRRRVRHGHSLGASPDSRASR